MLANQIISTKILPVSSDDTGEAAVVIMGLFHVHHLPIVDNNKLVGIISEDDIYANDVSKPISDYKLNNNDLFVKPNDHIFEVMGIMSTNKVSIIPVVDEKGKFLGVISQYDLLQFYATSFSFAEPGSIILLEVPRIDYSLEEISRLVEAENAVILSSFLSEIPKNNRTILVTIKLNIMDISDVISSLERHDYIVRSSFSEEEFVDELKDNYDHLMRYLDV